ncbi:hypothetical protein MARINON1_52021 [Marinobacter salarius]|nr:hypothetical protein MBHK15_110722 [Marinobacter salarius]VXC06904.1 hypothetical protein MARINON1_52021 [Marinobacter salarius]
MRRNLSLKVRGKYWGGGVLADNNSLDLHKVYTSPTPTEKQLRATSIESKSVRLLGWGTEVRC